MVLPLPEKQYLCLSFSDFCRENANRKNYKEFTVTLINTTKLLQFIEDLSQMLFNLKLIIS
jgi:predicted secreted protein